MDENKTNAAQANAQAPVRPQKVRRVGRFAFALLLIGAGILLLVQQFVPQFDLLSIVRFAPALLIVLGIEMLVYSSKPDVTVKFDWLSVLGCGFILCIVGVASLIPLFWGYVNPARDYARNNYSTQLQDQAYQALNADTDLKARINSLYVNVWFNHTDSGQYTLQDIDDVNLYIELSANTYADAATFAADCYRITQLVQQVGLPVDQFQFDTSNVANATGSRYSLNFLSSFFEGLTPEQLAQRVNCYYEYEGNVYSSEAERDTEVREILEQRITEDYVASHEGEYPDDAYLAEEVERQFQAIFPTAQATAETATA